MRASSKRQVGAKIGAVPTRFLRGVALLTAALGSHAIAANPQAQQSPAEQGIRLAAGRVLPTQDGIDADLERRLRETAEGRIHFLVRVRGPLTLSQHRALREGGVVLLQFLGRDTYVLSTSLPVEAGNPFWGLVRWADAFEPSDKVHPQLLARPLAPWVEVSGTDRVRALVVFFEDVDGVEVQAVFDRVGLRATFDGAGNTWSVEADLAGIRALAPRDPVAIVLPARVPLRASNSTARAITFTDQTQLPQNVVDGVLTYAGVTGEGIRIGICDLGIDETHPDFADADGDSPCADRLGRRFYRSRPNATVHGTHVASIAAGNGHESAAWDPPFALRGHAPRACLGDYIPFRADVMEFYRAIVCDSTDVTNHSYDVAMGPQYSADEASIDRVVRGGHMGSIDVVIPSRPQVWAAGNFGVCNHFTSNSDSPDSTPPPGERFTGYCSVTMSAKNPICVGSVDTVDGELSQFSSLGPTFDGRIKPDVVAPGARDSKSTPQPCPWDEDAWLPGADGIRAAGLSSTYAEMAGTSMAAPVVSGIIALMMETFYGSSPGDACGSTRARLLASTYKAILIHTAQDRILEAPESGREIVNPDLRPDPVVYHRGPDYATGYGLVDAREACATIARSRRWTEDVLGSQGETQTHCFDVPWTAQWVKVTLAWDDLPGSDQTDVSASKLVNDLDLELEDPDGGVHLPWVLPPLPLDETSYGGGPDPISSADITQAEPGVDTLNNVEMVSVPAAPGRWRVRVHARTMPMGVSQTYSLVTSDDMAWLCQVILQENVAVCEAYDWACEGPKVLPVFDAAPREWIWGSGSILPLRELRKVEGLPPLHDGFAWVPGPGFELVVRPLAAGSQIVLFDADGTIHTHARTPEGEGRIRVDGSPAGEQLFLLLADEDGSPFPDRMRLRIGVEMLE